jgi:hypothetical protein
MLKLGFTLERAAVPVPRKERLDPELVSRMPSGKRFRIVVEGTEEFTQLMQELTDHTRYLGQKCRALRGSLSGA